MSFDIVNPTDLSVVRKIASGEEYSLYATRNHYIEGCSVAIISHEITIIRHGLVLLSGIQGLLYSHSLLMQAELIDNGFVVTNVFNVSNNRVKVERGVCISKLVAL